MEKSGEKSGNKKYCEKCDYYARDNYDWTRHLSTRKHKMDNMDNKMDNMDNKKTQKVVILKLFNCDFCSKNYKFKSGLCKHIKKYHSNIKTTTRDSSVDKEKESLKEEVKELRTIMLEMMKAQSETNKQFQTTINRVIDEAGTTNNFNNKTSINIYLNEKCKDAMNLTDFVDQLKISLDDLMYTKNHGYVKGISNIFVKQLQDMKPTERPIHCSDRKRLQFYVKDEDKWEKDNNEKIDKTINKVSQKQIKMIKDWEKEHPNWNNNDNETIKSNHHLSE